jgi:hypothetical protein
VIKFILFACTPSVAGARCSNLPRKKSASYYVWSLEKIGCIAALLRLPRLSRTFKKNRKPGVAHSRWSKKRCRNNTLQKKSRENCHSFCTRFKKAKRKEVKEHDETATASAHSHISPHRVVSAHAHLVPHRVEALILVRWYKR